MKYQSDDERKFTTDEVTMDTSAYHSVTGKFKAERYPGSPLLDTNVTLDIPVFAITWNDRENLMSALAEVIKKYAI